MGVGSKETIRLTTMKHLGVFLVQERLQDKREEGNKLAGEKKNFKANDLLRGI